MVMCWWPAVGDGVGEVGEGIDGESYGGDGDGAVNDGDEENGDGGSGVIAASLGNGIGARAV